MILEGMRNGIRVGVTSEDTGVGFINDFYKSVVDSCLGGVFLLRRGLSFNRPEYALLVLLEVKGEIMIQYYYILIYTYIT